MTSWWRAIGREELAEKLESDLRPRELGDLEEDGAEAPAAPVVPVVANGSSPIAR